MKTVHYEEKENGALFVAKEGDEIDILSPITKQEFEDNFPEISTYGLETYFTVFIENGVILIDKDWNGEEYYSHGKHYSPVYQDKDEDFDVVGSYESNY